jgi:hypothetical protein
MAYVISPFNGAIVQVAADSPLLKTWTQVAGPTAVTAGPAPVTAPTTTQATTVSTAQSAEDRRRTEVGKLGPFSTIPAVAAIQKQAQEEYIKTGIWNPKYNADAEAIRKGLNAAYPGGIGEKDAQFFLPGAGSDQPNVDAVGSLWSALFGLFGKTADTASDAAGKATQSSNNGTFYLLIGAVLLLVMRRK